MEEGEGLVSRLAQHHDKRWNKMFLTVARRLLGTPRAGAKALPNKVKVPWRIDAKLASC